MAKAKRKELEILQSESCNSRSDEDSRVFCRFALNDVPVRFKDLKVGEKGGGVCKDIGGGGIGAEFSRELKPRTPLEMWVDLPDGFEPLHLLGKVVWSNQLDASCRVGVAFDRPRLMSLSRILKLGGVYD
ncbi:MAG: PilZ domain-containing protein [Candidatus Omnitrophota bacterium]